MSEEKELTPEEAAQKRNEMIKAMEAQIPFLQKQKEYQELITAVSELRMREVYSMVKIAEMTAPSGEESKPKSKLRALKNVQ